ncbi:serine hydrolase [Polymorphospora lycopeni]|uniref:Serine hydrolase n=1 Tax=Polymorphospora lycopeni TaxID=3140240 RepID=A0ABV5CN24_9ACTN
MLATGLLLLPDSPLRADAAPSWHGPGSPVTTSPATPSASPEPPPLDVRPTDVVIETTGWWSWSMIDQRTGAVYGSENMTETSTTASMIKSWVAADYLRRAAEKGETPGESRMAQLTAMIRDSDNEATQIVYDELGRATSIKRLIEICGLTDSEPAEDGAWSRTQLSARDTARMGVCITDGRAAGSKWTKWLLDEMRLVRGTGDFGIRAAFPTEIRKTIAIKNGWVDRQAEEEYHVNCLAIGDGWTAGVLTAYPIQLGQSHGAKICKQVGEQLRAD